MGGESVNCAGQFRHRPHSGLLLGILRETVYNLKAVSNDSIVNNYPNVQQATSRASQQNPDSHMLLFGEVKVQDSTSQSPSFACQGAELKLLWLPNSSAIPIGDVVLTSPRKPGGAVD